MRSLPDNASRSGGCLETMDNKSLIKGICATLIIIGIYACIFYAIQLFDLKKSICIVEKKNYEPYTCKDIDCGPTMNFKTEYYLTEINSGNSRWACDTHSQCNCCNGHGECSSITINKQAKYEDCYPIITYTMNKYQNIKNGSMIDCWIDGSGNYLIEGQTPDYGYYISRIMIITPLIISFVCLCVFTCVLLKRWHEKSNDNATNIDNIAINYNIMG